jgi:hypothetical protein
MPFAKRSGCDPSSRAWLMPRGDDLNFRDARLRIRHFKIERPHPEQRLSPTTSQFLLMEELPFNLAVDARKPLLGLVSLIFQLLNLSLEFLCPVFGRSELKGELVRHREGSIAIFLRHLGRLLQQGDDGAAGPIDGILMARRRCLSRGGSGPPGILGCTLKIHGYSPPIHCDRA